MRLMGLIGGAGGEQRGSSVAGSAERLYEVIGPRSRLA